MLLISAQRPLLSRTLGSEPALLFGDEATLPGPALTGNFPWVVVTHVGDGWMQGVSCLTAAPDTVSLAADTDPDPHLVLTLEGLVASQTDDFPRPDAPRCESNALPEFIQALVGTVAIITISHGVLSLLKE